MFRIFYRAGVLEKTRKLSVAVWLDNKRQSESEMTDTKMEPQHNSNKMDKMAGQFNTSLTTDDPDGYVV